MITVTLSIAAFVAISTMGYFIYSYRSLTKSAEAKFNSIKEFADNSGKEILKLQAENRSLKATISSMRVNELKAKPVSTPSNNPAPAIKESAAVVASSKPKRRYNKNFNKGNNANQK